MRTCYAAFAFGVAITPDIAPSVMLDTTERGIHEFNDKNPFLTIKRLSLYTEKGTCLYLASSYTAIYEDDPEFFAQFRPCLKDYSQEFYRAIGETRKQQLKAADLEPGWVLMFVTLF